MPTASTTSTAKSKRSTASSKGRATARKTSAAPRAQDAIALLKSDHRAVEKLFAQFEKAGGEDRKAQIAQQICMELRVHTQIEEEIFYPASRAFLDDDEIVNEAIVEHQAAKDLIDEIGGMEASNEMFDAKVTVLQEMIEHHVGEEEKEYFPKLQKTDMDLKAIGGQLADRKSELTDEMGDGVSATH